MKLRPSWVKKCLGPPSQKQQSLFKFRKSIWLLGVYSSHFWGKSMRGSSKVLGKIGAEEEHQGKWETVPGNQRIFKKRFFWGSVYELSHILCLALCISSLSLYCHSPKPASFSPDVLTHPLRGSPSCGDGQLYYEGNTNCSSLGTPSLLTSYLLVN